MQPIHDSLRHYQTAGHALPAIRIEIGDISLTSDGWSSCHNTGQEDERWDIHAGNRIISIDGHREEAYSHSMKLLLNNYDGAFTDHDFVGTKLYMFWGSHVKADERNGIEGGTFYCRRPALTVRQQFEVSRPGVSAMQLECDGIPDQLNRDSASARYILPDTLSLKDAIEDVFDTSLEPFLECTPYRVIFDSTDYLLTSVYPGSAFVVSKGESRLEVLERLLDMTYCQWRPGAEPPTKGNYYDTVHILLPKREGDSFDETFTVLGGENKFYSRSSGEGIFFPNHITVLSPTDEGISYSGVAQESSLIARNPYNKSPRTVYVANLTSNEQASQIAEVILSQVKAAKKAGSFNIPMHYGLDIHDYVQFTDQRVKTYGGEPVVRSGNVGVVERKWIPSKGVYTCDGMFGGWQTAKRLREIMGEDSGFVEDSEEEVGSQYNYRYFSFPIYYPNMPNGGTYDNYFILPEDGILKAWAAQTMNRDVEETGLYISLINLTTGVTHFEHHAKLVFGAPLASAPAATDDLITVRLTNSSGGVLANASGFMMVSLEPLA
jgi:hypothetical protein